MRHTFAPAYILLPFLFLSIITLLLNNPGFGNGKSAVLRLSVKFFIYS